MDSNLTSLWVKIANFDIDGEPTNIPFAAKLARTQGWSRRYAERVIEEYRRFVFLAMASDHPVSPSPDVDEAWHLHLTYTHSYWERLTKGVLPRPLHHNPAKGGKAEAEKHTDWYARTLESYETFFGASAPNDIWPTAGFGSNLTNRIVDTNKVWVVSKSKAKAALQAGAAAIAVASVAAGCVPLLGQASGFPTLWVVLGAAGAILVGGILWAIQRMGSDPSIGNQPHDPRRDSNTGMVATGCGSSGSYVSGTDNDRDRSNETFPSTSDWADTESKGQGDSSSNQPDASGGDSGGSGGDSGSSCSSSGCSSGD